MTYSRAKPYRLPPAKARAVASAVREQDAITTRITNQIVGPMQHAAMEVLERLLAGEPFRDPNLHGIDRAMEHFLRLVVYRAIRHADEQQFAESRTRTKRLGKYPKGRIPTIESLAELYNDTAAMNGMRTRNRLYTQRLKNAYLRKLRQYFGRLMPKLTIGAITPIEARSALERAVKATQPRVQTIFRTETTKYFAEAQRAFFDNEPGILGYLFDSVSDTARTDICRSRHGMVLPMGRKDLLKKNTPALHWNCRSHLIPLADTPQNRKMMEDPGRDPDRRSLAPLPPGWRS